MPAEYYPTLKALHVALVLASGALFMARGAGVLASATWPMTRPARVTSYVIDTGLLAAGIALLALLALDPTRVPWLGVKLALLPVYIVLGTMALKRARSARAAWFAAALACYALMISIARSRSSAWAPPLSRPTH